MAAFVRRAAEQKTLFIIPFMKELYGGYKEFGYHSTTLYGQDESVHDAWYRVYMR